MNFPKSANISGILEFIKPTIEQLLNVSKYGITIDIRPQTRIRSKAQNDYLWAIYQHIIDFNEEAGLSNKNGGYLPDHLMLNYIDTDFLHLYLKARFNIKTTTKLTTAEFCEYTDKIQHLMTEQSEGFYDPIYPDQPLQEIK